uniref:GT23 domain-containing protein n=1 Tax=Ditylenchus dipsaci TaxID=166011 RepID=A0A915EPL2_9BILA
MFYSVLLDKRSRLKLHNSVLEIFYKYHKELSKNQQHWKQSTNYLAQLLTLVAKSADFQSRDWHKKELDKLTTHIQSTLHRLQSPKNCSKARFIICEDRPAGFGSRLIQMAYCLILAAATKRTYLMMHDGAVFKYNPYGWTAVLKPISSCVFSDVVDIFKLSMYKMWYSNYKVYSNEEFTEEAQPKIRYDENSLVGVLTDINMLSKCDYVVCTGSSNICRIVYSLMTVAYGDMINRWTSLDYIYQFDPYQQDAESVATHAYMPPSQMK